MSRLKRAAALGGSVGCVIAGVVCIIWLLPAELTRHPSEGLKSVDRLKAANDVRGTLVTLAAVLAAVAGLIFTGRTYWLGRAASVADRYGRAIEQLASNSVTIRIGGVYALDSLASEGKVVRQNVMEVLAAFLRSGVGPGGDDRPFAQDRQAALSVLGHGHYSGMEKDLRMADLQRAVFMGLDLSGSLLSGADLSFAVLTDVDLTRADLSGADLRGATLSRVALAAAVLTSADLRGATLAFSPLEPAQISSATTDS